MSDEIAMDLSWADLTDEERERVTEVFTIARGRERLLYRQISRREGHDLIGEFEAFAKVIDGLSVEAKQILGPFRPETITGEFVPQSALEQIRHHVAFLISCHDPKAGRARQFAREEAVSELRKTWIARGGNPSPGQIMRERTEKVWRSQAFSPNAFSLFLANCLMHLDCELKTIEVAVSAAHSALRA